MVLLVCCQTKKINKKGKSYKLDLCEVAKTSNLRHSQLDSWSVGSDWDSESFAAGFKFENEDVSFRLMEK